MGSKQECRVPTAVIKYNLSLNMFILKFQQVFKFSHVLEMNHESNHWKKTPLKFLATELFKFKKQILIHRFQRYLSTTIIKTSWCFETYFWKSALSIKQITIWNKSMGLHQNLSKWILGHLWNYPESLIAH